MFRVDAHNGELDLDAVLKVLAEQGITRLMVEGGATVAASFVAADLVDEAVLLRADKAIGREGVNVLEGMPLSALTKSPRVQIARTGGDWQRQSRDIRAGLSAGSGEYAAALGQNTSTTLADFLRHGIPKSVFL